MGKKALALFLVTLVWGSLFSLNVRAVGGGTFDACSEDGILTLRCIPYLFSNIFDFALGAAGVVAVVFITISGVKFLSSGGDPIKVEGAKRTMTWAIVGLVVILLSFTILKIVGNFLTIDLLRFK